LPYVWKEVDFGDDFMFCSAHTGSNQKSLFSKFMMLAGLLQQ
jgi:hypothetical protein